MDEMDHAQIKMEIDLANAIRKATEGRKGPIATGRCLYCDEIVDDERRWCDKDCTSAWEREQAR